MPPGQGDDGRAHLRVQYGYMSTGINLMLLSVQLMSVLHLLVNQVIHNDGRISISPLLWKEMPMPEPQQVKRGECDGSLAAARPLGISSLGRGSPTLSLELC